MWLVMLSNDPWGFRGGKLRGKKNPIESQAITRKSVARIDTRNGVIRNRHAGPCKQIENTSNAKCKIDQDLPVMSVQDGAT